MTPRAKLKDALLALDSAIRDLDVPAAILGGIAVIVRGVDRGTRDVDAVLRGDLVEVARALEVLERHQIVPRVAGALEHARTRYVLLLVHRPSEVEIDLSWGFLPFEHEAIASAEPIPFDDVVIRVVRAEDLIVFKAIAWRDRDLDDLERLLVLWGSRIDLVRVRDWIRQFAEVLEVPERLVAFDRIVERALRE